jgi:uncharacterized phage protein gp47/JayE
MGVSLSDLITPTTKEAARAKLLAAAAGLGWAQVDGDSEGDVDLTGAPNGAYDVRLNILTTGSAATLTFRYSLDGGLTWSSSVSPTAGSYVLGSTGVTVKFTGTDADSFIQGDTFTVATFAPPLPVSSWDAFAVPRVLIEIFAVGFSILKNLILKIAAGGLNSLARGKWLTLLADETYDNQRFQGVPTRGIAKVTDAAGVGPRTLAAGVFLVKTASGLRYRAVNTVTLPKNGTEVPVLMQAESPGSQYNVGGSALVVLGTPLPGVTATNDTDWITVSGTDDETDPQLATRNSQKWSSLAPAFTDDGYSYYAKQAAPGAVARTHARVSPSVAGQVDLFLASANGGVASPAVDAVQAALDQIEPLTCTVNVQSATPHVFAITGVAYYFSSHAGTVASDVEAALAAFFATVDIGGVMYLSQLIDALQEVPGMRNVDLTGLVDTQLGDTEVATYTNSLTLTPVTG